MLAGGASYPTLTVTVNVADNAASSVSNQVTVSGGGSATATTADSTVILAGTAEIMAPAPGSTLAGTSTTFSWSIAAGADQYWLDVGNRVAVGDIWAGAVTGSSQLVAGIPCDGRIVYAQLYTHRGGAWLSPQRYVYTAPSGCTSAQVTAPTPGSVLAATSTTFTWSAATGADQYWLDVGNSIAVGDISAGAFTTTSALVNGIPCDGRTIHVQLYTHRSGVWLSPLRYTYSAPSGCASAGMASPTPGTVLTATTVTFAWNAASGADQYWVDVGNAVASGDISATALTGASKVVGGLPCDGRTIYVQLYTHRGGAWLSPQRYTYTAKATCAP